MKLTIAAFALVLGTATNSLLCPAAAASSQGLQLGAAPLQAGNRIRRNKKFLRRLQGGRAPYCDDSKQPNFASTGSPAKGRCLNFSKGGKDGTLYNYPDDFKTSTNEQVLNEVTHYECASEGKRVIISNGIPDHSHVQGNPNAPCEMEWYVELPLVPVKQESITETPPQGIIAMAINGVPAFGAQEAEGGNALDPNGNFVDASFWYGHATAGKVDHYHNPQMGQETVDDEDLLGFALDGFKIYGFNDKTADLDECNGMEVDGEYRYYVREVADVDLSSQYCGSPSGSTNWNYILGCYHGDVTQTKYGSSAGYQLPDGCVEVDPSVKVDPTCQDQTNKFKYVTNKGKTKKKKCTWVAKNTSNRCKIEIKDSDLKVKHVCPKSCGKC